MSAAIGTRPALLRVRIPSGAIRTFLAEKVEIRDGMVIAVGCWRGSDATLARAWPTRRVLEIRGGGS